jgi:hypothetical protein
VNNSIAPAGRTPAHRILPLAILVLGGSASLPASDPPSGAALTLGSDQAREAPAHRLAFDVAAGDPEIFRAALTYPAGFTIDGFPASRPAGTPVGVYEIDVDRDGAPERRAPLRVLDPSRAYADVVPDGTFEAGIEPLLVVSDRTFELRLPFGGDGNPATITSPIDARASLVLAPGIVSSPALGGRYVVTATLATVDPDSGGPDDGRNAAPVVRTFELPVDIEGPRLVRFARFTIHAFDLDVRAHRDDGFALDGRFVPGQASDGIQLASEEVSIAVGPFRQTIPGRAFTAWGGGYHYRGPGPGIRTLTLWRTGHFQIEARGLHWISGAAKPGPVPVALRIGNDHGDTTTPGHRHGKH